MRLLRKLVCFLRGHSWILMGGGTICCDRCGKFPDPNQDDLNLLAAELVMKYNKPITLVVNEDDEVEAYEI